MSNVDMQFTKFGGGNHRPFNQRLMPFYANDKLSLNLQMNLPRNIP